MHSKQRGTLQRLVLLPPAIIRPEPNVVLAPAGITINTESENEGKTSENERRNNKKLYCRERNRNTMKRKIEKQEFLHMTHVKMD